jgi:hypothetical protein
MVPVFFLVFSCGGGVREEPLVPPPTDPLRREYIGYGVARETYTHVVEEPGEGRSVLGYLRRGSLVRVLERRYSSPGAANSGRETWVLVEGAYRGWLPEREIQIFDSEARARTAAESLNR